MKRAFVCTALGALAVIYATVTMWLILTGHPGKMMAAAILAAMPLVIGVDHSLRVASRERAALKKELRELNERIDALIR